MKVIIRRLAPGLTEAEFTSILGDDWRLGGGKVDWFLYKPGKDSKEYIYPTSLFAMLTTPAPPNHPAPLEHTCI